MAAEIFITSPKVFWMSQTVCLSAGRIFPKDMRPYCQEISILIRTDQVYSYNFWDEEIVFYLNRFITKIDAEELRRLMNQKKQKILYWKRIYLISNKSS